MTSITPASIMGTAFQAVGGVTQGAASAAQTATSQAALTDAAGTPDTVEAQRNANEAQDKNGANLTSLMSDATIANLQQSTMNAINSMQMDTNNKEISALAKNSTGINF